MPFVFRLLFFFFFLFTSSISIWAMNYPPAVFVNDIPGPVIIKTGQEPEIPIFLLMGSLADKEVEFFVWREWGNQDLPPEIISQKEYLSLEDSNLSWKPFETYDELKPFVKAALPFYLRFDWRSSIFLSPFDWETNPPPQGGDLFYDLYICFDDRIDNLPPSEEDFKSVPPHAVCGKAQVVFENTCIPSDIIVEGLTNGALEASFIKGFSPPNFSLELRDNCNQMATCEVKNVPSFLAASMQPGLLSLTVKSDLNADNYSGNMVLSCNLGSESKEISFPVRIEVLEEAPGDCNGTLLINSPSGEKIYNGGELSLNISEDQTVPLTLICQRAFFPDPVSDFLAQTSGQCFTVEKEGSSLIIKPVGDTSCSDNLTVASGKAVSTITVKLNVGNSCVPSKVELSPSGLSFTSSGSKTVYIKDDCGNALPYRVTDVSASWITSPKEGATGQGNIVVSVNTAGLSSGLHTGHITISPQGFDPVTVSVTVNVASAQTLSVWPTEASASLDVGESKDLEVTATCSGLPPSQCSVTKLTGEDWFTISDCNNGNITVHFNASGLTSGQTYEGSFKVSTSCGSTTVPVELRVTGVCEPSSATLSKTSLSLATQVGNSPSAQTIYVKDNCGKSLNFTVEGVTYAQEDYTNWLSYPSSGSGSLTLSFDTSSLPIGTYSASLTIKPEGYNELTFTVSLSVEETPPSPPVSAIPLTRGEEYITSFRPQEEKLFSFYSSSTSSYPYLSVMIVTPSSYSLSYLKVILLNAGPECESPPPTKEQLQELIDKYYSGEISSTTGHIGDLYYDVSNGLVRRLAVFEDLSRTCWYLYIYNDSSTQSYSGVRVSYTGP